MAAVDTGKSFANGEQLTAAKLNQMFGNSTFGSGAVDNSTISIDTSGKLAVNQITSSNIANNAIGLSDLAQVSTDKVLGRLSDESGNVEQITVDEDLTSVSANHDELATSKAIKDYVDAEIDKTIGHNQTWQLVTRAVDSTEYTNDTGKPIMVNGSFSGDADSHVVYISIKPSGGSYMQFVFARSTNSGGGVVSNGSTIVPVNSVYKFNKTGDTISSETFHELR
tara:strand:+ start:7050 stop:7721 length:672 start_codon:yes stop_codon:yes gene_type:complete